MTKLDMRGVKHRLRYTPEYALWLNIRQRCTNPNHHSYSYYGGRGITVCERWNDPVNFISDIGQRPEGHEIDRIDNDKGYSKENCRWVLKKPQMQNTRLSKWWYVNGVRYASLTEAASFHNVNINTIKKWCDGRDDGKYVYPPKPNCWSEKKYEN